MTAKKIADAKRKVVDFAAQWGIDPIKIEYVPNDDGFTFMIAQSEDIYDGKHTLDVREWTCPKCGMNHDRDINAAKNILAA